MRLDCDRIRLDGHPPWEMLRDDRSPPSRDAAGRTWRHLDESSRASCLDSAHTVMAAEADKDR